MALTQVSPALLNDEAQAQGFRNRIINGAMTIDQRNAGASVTPTNGQYTLDRYVFYVSQASKLTCQQNAGSVNPPIGFTKYLGVTSSSAYSVVSGDYFCFMQGIEGLNVADLAWGTANAKTITLSFQVYSSLTGTFGGTIRNLVSAATRSYPFTYTISSANTWTQISVTITGDTTGTWATDNTSSLTVSFGLGAGSTFSGTAGSWQAGNYVSATGATSVVGTNGATFYITGVQLEVGSVATEFERRPYGTELALCQRYYFNAVGTGTSSVQYWPASLVSAGGTYVCFCKFPVTMRATPTLIDSGTTGTSTFYLNWPGSGSSTLSSMALRGAGTDTATFSGGQTTSFGGAGYYVHLEINNTSFTGIYAWSAEL